MLNRRGEKKRSRLKKRVKKITGYRPGNLDLFRTAMIHKSVATRYANGKFGDNERLEFLGDSILDSIIAEYLYTKFQDKNEGFLTKLKAKIVKRKNLDQLALILGLDEMIKFKNFHNDHKHIYGNALEALIGALYLDKGYRKTRKFIINKLIGKHIDIDSILLEDTDYKSKLIEWGQKNRQSVVFESFDKTPGNSSSPLFHTQVKIASNIFGEGTGNSKKEAEQNAAMKALKYIENLNNNTDA